MKTIILTAAIVLSTGILSTLTIRNNVKPATIKASTFFSMNLRSDLATAD